MYNKTINIAVVAEVASALGELKDRMIFVGGSIISLYTDDPAADEIRPTADVDMTISVLNYPVWTELQEQLLSLGFSPNAQATHINRLFFNEIPVDVIPMEKEIIGETNRWYKVGLDSILEYDINGEVIKIFSAPVYLATKFEAFNSRGTDLRTSHDIEDIIYILDNRTTIVQEILESESSVNAFIKEELQQIIKIGMLDEVLMSHIHPLMLEERIPLVQEKITQILE